MLTYDHNLPFRHQNWNALNEPVNEWKLADNPPQWAIDFCATAGYPVESERVSQTVEFTIRVVKAVNDAYPDKSQSLKAVSVLTKIFRMFVL